jgi:hypothetical protein
MVCDAPDCGNLVDGDGYVFIQGGDKPRVKVEIDKRIATHAGRVEIAEAPSPQNARRAVFLQVERLSRRSCMASLTK